MLSPGGFCPPHPSWPLMLPVAYGGFSKSILRVSARAAPVDHPRRLLLPPLVRPPIEDHLGPVDVGERALEVAVIARRARRHHEEEPVPPLLEDVRDVEHPDELAETRVDHARIAAVDAGHHADLIDTHAARAAVVRRELDPSRVWIVHALPPRKRLRGDTLTTARADSRSNSDTRGVGARAAWRYRIWGLFTARAERGC